MNRNTLLAFALILATIWFFNSDIYYEKILRRPNPAKIGREAQRPVPDTTFREPERTPDTVARNTAREQPPEASPPDTDTAIAEAAPGVGEDTVWVETDKLICGISERGGRIVSLKTKDYTYGHRRSDDSGSALLASRDIIELLPDNGRGGANLTIGGVDYDSANFEANVDSVRLGGGSDSSGFVELVHPGRDRVVKRFTFERGSYRIGYEIWSPLLSAATVTAGWEAGIAESEAQTAGFGGGYQPREVHVYDGTNVEHISKKKEGERDLLTGAYRWAGVTSKYFMVAILGDKPEESEIGLESFVASGEVMPKGKKETKVLNYGISMKRSPDEASIKYWIYAGPTQLSVLRSYDMALQKVLFSGWKWFLRADIWFPVLSEWVLWLLIALVGALKDYGIAIIVLTILLRLATFPMTQSSSRSMARMKDLQPKINTIRQRYKTDPRKMNEEVMALYKAEGINPFNPGCLPMVLQMPMFISLYVVLNKAIELRGASTFLIPWVKDLSQPESLPLISPLPFTIPFYGNNVALLPILMAVLTFVQNKMTIKDPNQKAMIYFMPIMMLFLFNNFPAGLVLYWTFSNALGILQQWYTNQSIAKREAAKAAVAAVTPKMGARRRR